MEPRALTKAASLRHFALTRGAQLCTFVLCLSDDEGLELIDWLAARNADNDLLQLDAVQAHLERDPWAILANFQLLGLDLMPKAVLH